MYVLKDEKTTSFLKENEWFQRKWLFFENALRKIEVMDGGIVLTMDQTIRVELHGGENSNVMKVSFQEPMNSLLLHRPDLLLKIEMGGSDDMPGMEHVFNFKKDDPVEMVEVVEMVVKHMRQERESEREEDELSSE